MPSPDGEVINCDEQFSKLDQLKETLERRRRNIRAMPGGGRGTLSQWRRLIGDGNAPGGGTGTTKTGTQDRIVRWRDAADTKQHDCVRMISESESESINRRLLTRPIAFPLAFTVLISRSL